MRCNSWSTVASSKRADSVSRGVCKICWKVPWSSWVPSWLAWSKCESCCNVLKASWMKSPPPKKEVPTRFERLQTPNIRIHLTAKVPSSAPWPVHPVSESALEVSWDSPSTLQTPQGSVLPNPSDLKMMTSQLMRLVHNSKLQDYLNRKKVCDCWRVESWLGICAGSIFPCPFCVAGVGRSNYQPVLNLIN